MKLPDYPGVSSFQDRHGKTRWRFRKTGMKPVPLLGEPGSKPFVATYKAAIEGRIVKKAEVVRHPRAAHPASLTAAWVKIRSLSWWSQLDPKTQENYRHEIEQARRFGRPAMARPAIAPAPISSRAMSAISWTGSRPRGRECC